MDFVSMWSGRRAHRGQSGVTVMGVLMAAGSTATVAGLFVLNGGDPVSAAEESACAYDKKIVLTAIDTDYLMDGSLQYATPAGPDGLDEVRAAGFLRSESRYWRYEGLDGTGQPRVVAIDPVNGCA